MFSTLVETGAGLCVLAGEPAGVSGRWSGALSGFFTVARRVLAGVRADVRLGRLGPRVFLYGQAGDHGLGDVLDGLMDRIDLEYAIELQSPFEDTASIAGALWSGREILGNGFDDGLAKLRFGAGTLDLPLHVHEHSDRFIAVLDGSGRFWWSHEPLAGFTGAGIQSVAVRPGDVLVFSRDLLHTFSAPTQDLVLLSYHSPEIAFDDPRQYTLPDLIWSPRAAAPVKPMVLSNSPVRAAG